MQKRNERVVKIKYEQCSFYNSFQGNTLHVTLAGLVSFVCAFNAHSVEIDQKLQEIMKQTGYLKIDGQVGFKFQSRTCWSYRSENQAKSGQTPGYPTWQQK